MAFNHKAHFLREIFKGTLIFLSYFPIKRAAVAYREREKIWRRGIQKLRGYKYKSEEGRFAVIPRN